MGQRWGRGNKSAANYAEVGGRDACGGPWRMGVGVYDVGSSRARVVVHVVRPVQSVFSSAFVAGFGCHLELHTPIYTSD